MEIRVDTYIEDLEGMRRPINRAYLTLVAMNAKTDTGNHIGKRK